MIAVDSSSFIAYFAGDEGDDVDWVDQALAMNQIALPPVVLTEMLSRPGLEDRVARLLGELPVLDLHAGFWTRAAATRGLLLARRLRARLADTLIAQTCIDHRLPLITRDGDFRHFAAHAGLTLA